MAIITPNNLDVKNQVAPAPSLHDDGSNYEWRMCFNEQSEFADADELHEFISILFDPEYSALETDEEKAKARIVYAHRFQVMARARVLANMTEEQSDALSEEEWAVLTYGEDLDSADPYGWGSGTLGTVGEDFDTWSSDIPLVLVSTSYAPYTEIPRPISSEGDYKYVKNIIWIRPESEIDFLRSLKHTGYIAFGKPQAAPRADARARANSEKS